jgi:acyl-CoA thioester hydrolase
VKHRYDCRIRWSDVDSYGHVNNVKYFEYLQEARIAFLSALSPGWPRGREGAVLARIDVDYRRPIRFRPEPVVVETWVTRIGRSSYDLGSRIIDDQPELATVFAEAQAVIVAYDVEAQRSRPLTAPERSALEKVGPSSQG